MFQDNLGPSSYRKAQGRPVRVWGMLADGVLNIVILEDGDVMNHEIYADLIDDKFEDWMGSCTLLVQDFERSLRSQPALVAFQRVGIELVENYPKVSQDFNAIENAWKILRDRLNVTMPTEFEGRDDFVVRLKAAVRWMNHHKASELEYVLHITYGDQDLCWYVEWVAVHVQIFSRFSCHAVCGLHVKMNPRGTYPQIRRTAVVSACVRSDSSEMF